ncbi:YgdB family protein [Nissabacter sp. SGAir0207]|uniref:YgdB family protein n=1 Tax=Nissabacter sp. SGAir0207 TaxID=2126321 RepID=UPI0010CCEF0E|nr:YgdB family protein [Nissabacter sp. SGAir0207]QCR35157.1 DUF2509 domain-containing protein [Nissabacter sp. SGAir0207]
MSAVKQRGNALLLTLLGMMALGLAGLQALHGQLDEAVRMTGDTRRTLLAWNQAASALAWGTTQRWPEPPPGRWQCRTSDAGRSCLKASTQLGGYLLRGQGQVDARTPLYLYQLVTRDGEGQVQQLAGGWLDFCPERERRDCDVQEVP